MGRFNDYPVAVEEHLGGRVDYGQIVKVFGPETVNSERRYSPPAMWMHSSIRMTPAMKAGLARKPWTVRDLMTA